MEVVEPDELELADEVDEDETANEDEETVPVASDELDPVLTIELETVEDWLTEFVDVELVVEACFELRARYPATAIMMIMITTMPTIATLLNASLILDLLESTVLRDWRVVFKNLSPL